MKRSGVIDLFAGAGGWDVGARSLGLDPVGLELDADCCETRRAAGLRTMRCDIAAVSLDESTGWTRDTKEGLIASPPCQGFSRAGKMRGLDDGPVIQTVMQHLGEGEDLREQMRGELHDERSLLVVEPLRWTLHLRPRWVALEQVPSVLPFWDLTAELLEAVGYHCWTGLLRAEMFGVPQTRKRAFLLASLDGPVGPPAPTHSRYHERSPSRLDEGVLPWVSMAEALGWGDGAMAARRTHVTPQGTPDATRELQGPDWPFRRPATTLCCDPRVFQPGGHHVPGQQSMNAIRVTPEQAARLQTFPTHVRFGNQSNSAVRAADQPAATLRYSNRMSACDAFDGHPSEDGEKLRRVEVGEAAALQSYPDGFPWQGSRTSQFRQIGNAVPCLLAEHVLRAAMR